MEWIKKQQAKVKFLGLVNDPTKTNKIFEIVDIVSNMKTHENEISQIEDYILSDSSYKEMSDSQWIPKLPKMDFLQNCDKQSLGYAYYKHLSENNLDIDFFPKIKINRPIDYLTYRTYVSHDLWHTILGHGTTPLDEIKVQAFALGQFKSGIALMLIAGGIIHLLENSPSDALEAFEEATKEYERGKKSGFLLSHKLEDMLELPLEEVRTRVGLVSS